MSYVSKLTVKLGERKQLNPTLFLVYSMNLPPSSNILKILKLNEPNWELWNDYSKLCQ